MKIFVLILFVYFLFIENTFSQHFDVDISEHAINNTKEITELFLSKKVKKIIIYWMGDNGYEPESVFYYSTEGLLDSAFYFENGNKKFWISNVYDNSKIVYQKIYNERKTYDICQFTYNEKGLLERKEFLEGGRYASYWEYIPNVQREFKIYGFFEKPSLNYFYENNFLIKEIFVSNDGDTIYQKVYEHLYSDESKEHIERELVNGYLQREKYERPLYSEHRQTCRSDSVFQVYTTIFFDANKNIIFSIVAYRDLSGSSSSFEEARLYYCIYNNLELSEVLNVFWGDGKLDDSANRVKYFYNEKGLTIEEQGTQRWFKYEYEYYE